MTHYKPGYLETARAWTGRRAPATDSRMNGREAAFAVRQRLTGRREKKPANY
jgi:hypothetical protein